MTSRTMTFCKAILLLIGLSAFATMVACSGGGHTTTTTNTVAITATGGTPQSVAVGTPFAVLVATVTTNGTPTAGATVTFAAPSSGATGTFASNSTATETQTTDATGKATSSVFTANTTAGAYTVTASTTGAATAASFSLTNLAGAPTTITPTSGSTPQSAAVGMPFGSALGATVVDGDGNPVSGAVVTFTAVPVSGASGTFSNSTATEMDTTGANGVATSSTFTANAVPGAYTVTATVTGVATAATFILTNTVGAAGSITATGGTPQSASVNKAFTSPLSATVLDGSSNPISGASVTFTAVPVGGASGTFNNGTATENDTTNASGVATSSTFTANATAGIYTVTATVSGVATPATFNLTNNAATLAAGSYVFSLSGTDTHTTTGFYAVAGQFTVGSGGVITGGEQDLIDPGVTNRDLISGTGSTVVSTSDGNVQITLTVCNGLDCTSNDTSVGVAGVETLQATLVSSSKALITEFDTSATSSGEVDLQAASPATPSGSYAFFASGVNNSASPLSMGGIINVDVANGGIDGAGSVFDVNNGGTVFSNQTFQPSSASLPDSMGRTAFTLNSTNNPPFITAKLVGYIIDANRIALVEGSDLLGGILGGFARAQAHTGGFNKASISGDSYVFGTAGADGNGPLQAAGVLTFSSTDNSVTGNLSFNDFTSQAPSGGETVVAGAIYLVDPTGRVTITGLTDASAYFLYNYQFYIDGSGHAEVISMDPAPGLPDVQGGIAFKQTTTALTAASISGNYAVDATQVTLTGDEQDGVGTVLADGVGTFAGFLDVNETFVPTADLAVSGTFAVPSGTPPNGLFTGTIKDAVTGTTGNFNYYFVDNTRGVAIQIDNTQLTLGTFLLEQ